MLEILLTVSVKGKFKLSIDFIIIRWGETKRQVTTNEKLDKIDVGFKESLRELLRRFPQETEVSDFRKIISVREFKRLRKSQDCMRKLLQFLL
jgi:hypothetical protein